MFEESLESGWETVYNERPADIILNHRKHIKQFKITVYKSPLGFFRLYVFNHNSGMWLDIDEWEEVKATVLKIRSSTFSRGQIVKDARSGFTKPRRIGYPLWLKQEVMDEIIEEKKSLNSVARERKIGCATISKWLHQEGYYFHMETSKRNGVWKKEVRDDGIRHVSDGKEIPVV